MAEKTQDAGCSSSTGSGGGCCRVEALVSVDERGQMVLPKEIRERAGIKAGDKLAVVALEHDNCLCCISLIKVDDLTEMVKIKLGPAMEAIFQDR